jgi:hypothetical protein
MMGVRAGGRLERELAALAVARDAAVPLGHGRDQLPIYLYTTPTRPCICSTLAQAPT